MGIRNSILVRMRVAFLLTVGFGMLIVGRIGYVQTVEGNRWIKKSQENGLAYRIIKANRGNILSDNNSLLATSVPYYRLAFDATIAKDEVFNKGVDSLAKLLAFHFEEKTAEQLAAELRTARKQGKKYKLLVKKDLSFEEKKLVSTFPILKEGRKRGGILFEKYEKRVLPFAGLARRTVGFVMETGDSIGSITGKGLELSFQDKLAGMEGQAIFQKVAGGHWKPFNDGWQVQPEHGADVETTLNLDIQEVADQALRKALVEHEAEYGCMAIMEVETGEVKAVVNLTRTEGGGYMENDNYLVGESALAEPGSTFKMMSFAALFEANPKLTLTDSIQTGNGSFQFFQDAVMTDPRAGGYGKITIKEVFEKSSNIGTSKLIYQQFRQEPDKFIEALNRFGITQGFDFQMNTRSVPYIKTPRDPSWSGSTLPWMSVGYEMKLTPLHTLAFCNAIANKGKMIQPFIVKRIKYANSVAEEYEAKVINPKTFSSSTLSKMQILMEGVVENGTAKTIKTPYYKIAGKTGTSEKVEKGKYTEKHYTSFVGYFPADRPQYSGIVVISNSKTGRYGGKTAAPVFKEVSDYVYRTRYMIPLSNEKIETAPPMRAGIQNELKFLSKKLNVTNESFTIEPWVVSQEKGDTLRWKGNPISPESVPNVVGMTLKDALFLLENKGLKVRYIGRGKITHQSVRSGTKITKGREILLTLG